jgi:dipeptidyl aminopeptidase/acylaminoacyl peptidase
MAGLLAGNSTTSAQQSYSLPPQAVIDVIDAPPVPLVSLSPDHHWMLVIRQNAMPGIDVLARRMLRLAGMRIDPVANAPFRTRYYQSLALRTREGGDMVPIPLPSGVKIAGVRWSHLSDMFAISTVTEQGQQLWVVSVDSPGEPRLLSDRLNTVMGSYDWMPDGRSLVCQTVPKDRGNEPESSGVPVGPNIQESIGLASPTRTFQDLLTCPADEALFAHFATAQLSLLSVDGSIKEIGSPEIFLSVQVSPSGQQFLVTTVQRPFSYLLTVGGFPKNIEVWDREGRHVTTVAKVPMEENIPIEGVRQGPRGVEWKEGMPATLVWMEALDGGDPNQKVPHRDRLLMLAEPFSGEPQEVVRTEHRGMGFFSMANPYQMAVTEYDRDRRWIRTLLHDLASPQATPIVLMDRSRRDRYNDPGSIVMQPDESGFPRAVQQGDWIFRMGDGASPEGDLPFLDRQNLITLETQRLWRCEPGRLERPEALLLSGNGELPNLIISRESQTTPPNLFLRDLRDNSEKMLTDFPDPTPQIRGIQKQLVKYKRSDGVDLSATLYLPADYQAGQRLPLVVWAYPLEFNDPSTAGQISGSPHQFVRMAGITHLALLTQGYAIMDNATMPVVGDPETMNDTFIDQIVASAQACIDKAVDMGVADRNRVAVGGHSYGAFMTANLLAHSRLFRAGIARSGAYNRTLTPFGFQSERRDFWKAKEVYYKLSPFMHADQIKEPILLIHGEADDNPGTFPLQSQRLYQAIKGNGGTVRLVMLPHESHGYVARESVLHTHAETIAWLDQYVKNAPESQ